MNISNTHDCYGCGVCDVVCPKNIIEIKLNKDGFYEPRITDAANCIDCGMCMKVCSFNNDGVSLKDQTIHSYAAWSKDSAVRQRCSSGGVGYELGKHLIGEGYKVCAVKYDAEKNQAEHYVATTVEELLPSIGSKYIQSYTVDGFRAINRKEKYLVTGTPCQIDSFRRYIQKFHCEDNFVLMDFFCHGVPSKLMWDKYVASAEQKVGKLTYVSWRNKRTGWHDSWAMAIDGEDVEDETVDWHDSYNLLTRGKKNFIYGRLSQGDPFYKLFLGDQCLGKQCYENCKFKYDHSSADIRIGDLWGKTYEKDEKGISGAVAFTEKGDALLHAINCELVEHPFGVVAEGQMQTMPQRSALHDRLFAMLHDQNTTIEEIYAIQRAYNNRQRNINRLKHPVRTTYHIIKKIIKKL